MHTCLYRDCAVFKNKSNVHMQYSIVKAITEVAVIFREARVRYFHWLIAFAIVSASVAKKRDFAHPDREGGIVT